jgi:hypothetical protein
MSWTASDVIIFILGQLVVGAAIWGSIRTDIRHMHDKIKDIDRRFTRHEERIDSIYGNGWNGTDRRGPNGRS